MKIHTPVAILLMMAFLVTGCASAGKRFNSSRVGELEPGVTTIEEAKHILEAEPVQVILNDSGRKLAIWRYITSSGLTANTSIQEVALVFGPDGKFLRVFQLINVPLKDEDERRLSPMSTVVQ
jgi:hypothetical protein